MTSSGKSPNGYGYPSSPPPPPPEGPPPSYTEIDDVKWQPDPSLTAMAAQDSRTSSSQSLVPDPATVYNGRRRLLLVYLHGFLGDETSFRSFPAHVHNLVTITMAESHVVHTKIYPKYRSRFAIEVARDNFSKWLTPNETPDTDIILLGHSMGGLLAAEIALLFRHRIIGIINFDVPFLGMHPGIVKAGLTSIFKPWPTPEEGSTAPGRMNTLFNPKPSDPNYNPSFSNDVHLPIRKGWENAMHFMKKHSSELVEASKGLVKSHFEFGYAMADYSELKARYARVRALEEDDVAKRRSANAHAREPPRVRFINYYTASTGRPKKPKTPKSPSPSRPSSRGLTAQSSNSTAALASSSLLALNPQLSESTNTTSPRISVDEHRGKEVVPVTPQEPPSATTPTHEPPLDNVTPQPIDQAHEVSEIPLQSSQPPELPTIPEIPQEPPFVDIAQFTDKAERRAAEKEHSRALKEYQQKVKARNKVIKERTKITEKWEKQQAKESQKEKGKQPMVDAPANSTDSNEHNQIEKADSGHESDPLDEDFGAMQLGAGNAASQAKNNPYGSYDFSRSAILSQPNPEEPSANTAASSQYTESTYTLDTLTTTDTNASNPTHDPQNPDPPKKKRFKKFCLLPPTDAYGNKDPTWVRVFMSDVDAVTAHTTLFFMSDTYERLVGEVSARIEDWMRESESLRVAREMEEMYGGGA